MLAAKDYDGKVLVLGPRTSPMVAAVRALGKTLGLAMLPLLATPFSAGTLRDAVASLLHAKASADPRRRNAEASGARRPSYVPAEAGRAHARAQRRRGGDAAVIRANGSSMTAIRVPPPVGAGDRPAGGGLAQLSCPDRAAVEIALELPIAFFRGSGVGRNAVPAVARSPGLRRDSSSRSTPRRPLRELGLVKTIAKQLRFRNIAISIKDVATNGCRSRSSTTFRSWS